MQETTDGFRIAEADLEIRGPGELFGTRQSGILNLQIANLVTDGPIVEKARKQAAALVKMDPELSHPEHRMLTETLFRQYREKFGLLRVG